MVERIESDLLASNVFVVSNDNHCIIFDAGAYVEKVKKVVGDRKVDAIFLTHGHYDHCFMVEDYIKTFECDVYASENIVEYLQNADYNYSEGNFVFDDFSHFHFLSGSGVIKFPHFSVSYAQLGGHSKSDMLFQVFDNIFVGDILLGRDIGRMDLYGGDKQEMKKSLEFLLSANYVTMHSGHGKPNDKQTQDKVIKLWLKYLSRN